MSSSKTKPCGYGCGSEIYWDDNIKRYCNVNNREPHRCPNYKPKTQTSGPTTTTQQTTATTTTTAPREQYTSQKTVMENSFFHITGTPLMLKLGYERISDIIRDVGGKIHGSQRGTDSDNKMDLMVYYEVPQGWRIKVEEKMNISFRDDDD